MLKAQSISNKNMPYNVKHIGTAVKEFVHNFLRRLTLIFLCVYGWSVDNLAFNEASLLRRLRRKMVKMPAVNANFLHYCLSIVPFMKRESENKFSPGALLTFYLIAQCIFMFGECHVFNSMTSGYLAFITKETQ